MLPQTNFVVACAFFQTPFLRLASTGIDSRDTSTDYATIEKARLTHHNGNRRIPVANEAVQDIADTTLHRQTSRETDASFEDSLVR